MDRHGFDSSFSFDGFRLQPVVFSGWIQLAAPNQLP
jgi:hypothetical protein